jgi:hypothetical protein
MWAHEVKGSHMALWLDCPFYNGMPTKMARPSAGHFHLTSKRPRFRLQEDTHDHDGRVLAERGAPSVARRHPALAHRGKRCELRKGKEFGAESGTHIQMFLDHGQKLLCSGGRLWVAVACKHLHAYTQPPSVAMHEQPIIPSRGYNVHMSNSVSAAWATATGGVALSSLAIAWGSLSAHSRSPPGDLTRSRDADRVISFLILGSSQTASRSQRTGTTPASYAAFLTPA